LRRNNASCDNDWRSAAALDLVCEPIRQRRGRGKFQVVFQISADPHAVRKRAQGAHAIRIFLALHKEGGGIGKRVFQEGTQEKAKNSKILLVACKRASRNAAADEEYGNLTSPGFLQEIRPDLGLQ